VAACKRKLAPRVFPIGYCVLKIVRNLQFSIVSTNRKSVHRKWLSTLPIKGSSSHLTNILLGCKLLWSFVRMAADSMYEPEAIRTSTCPVSAGSLSLTLLCLTRTTSQIATTPEISFQISTMSCAWPGLLNFLWLLEAQFPLVTYFTMFSIWGFMALNSRMVIEL